MNKKSRCSPKTAPTYIYLSVSFDDSLLPSGFSLSSVWYFLITPSMDFSTVFLTFPYNDIIMLLFECVYIFHQNRTFLHRFLLQAKRQFLMFLLLFLFLQPTYSFKEIVAFSHIGKLIKMWIHYIILLLSGSVAKMSGILKIAICEDETEQKDSA